MKHYTDTIPLPLAEKLKDKGMPIILGKRYLDICPNSEDDEMPYQVLCSATYAEVFDWLMEKRIYFTIYRTIDFYRTIDYYWRMDIICNGDDVATRYNKSWHEAANQAIEKALTLI